MSIGQNIKNARKSKGLSQKQLGELLGVSQAAIGQFENEKSTPKIETIKKIATALDIPVSELVSSEFVAPLGAAAGMANFDISSNTPLGASALWKPQKESSKGLSTTLQPEQFELSSKDIALFNGFHSLNNQGQEKVMTYLEDIAGNPKYTK